MEIGAYPVYERQQLNMEKLLVIVGPTATGKTKLAIHLSKALDGEIVSADSRQAYRYMDIGTGKRENPKSEARSPKILGYDLVRPDENFSVKKYVDFAYKTISEIYQKGKLPILVGGTGLYVKAVVDGLARINVPRDKELRRKLESKNVEELYKILKEKDLNKALSLNDSDRYNPRRLVRALEVVYSNEVDTWSEDIIKFDDVLWIGLTTSSDELNKRIDKRVDERVKMGFEEEVEFLKKSGYWEGVTKDTLGYREWPDVERWKTAEHQYAKRQMTWFKKDSRLKWFDIGVSNYQKEVVKLAQKWYSSDRK